MYLLNTLTGQKQEFTSLEPGIVRMYTCGPTVYRDVHIGNIRSYLMADWLRRALDLLGYHVQHVKNITDVGHMRYERLHQGEDKVIAAAIKEGKTPQEIASYYTDKFLKDEKSLNINPPDYMPKATDHINEMLEMIDILIQKKIAYEVNQNVYFDISKSENYGILSGNISNLETLNNEEVLNEWIIPAARVAGPWIARQGAKILPATSKALGKFFPFAIRQLPALGIGVTTWQFAAQVKNALLGILGVGKDVGRRGYD